MGCGAVEADGFGPALGRYGVGFKAFAVGHVCNQNFFVRSEADIVHKVAVDAEAAGIFEFGFGDAGMVQF